MSSGGIESTQGTLHPQSAVWLAAHTAPFNETTTWGGVLPRLPDGDQKGTNIQQIRLQIKTKTDADGEFRLIIPGDPFQHPFPILDHTMCVQLNQQCQEQLAVAAGGTPGAIDNVFDDITHIQQTYIPGASPGSAYPQTSPSIAGSVARIYSAQTGAVTNNQYCGRALEFNNLLTQIALAYENNYPNLIEQLMGLVPNNSAYRVIGQGARVWSLQGELQNATGIIRAATIDSNMWLQNTDTRSPFRVTDRYVSVIGDSAQALAMITHASPAFCSSRAQNSTLYPINNLACESPYGGLLWGLQWDLANGLSGNPFPSSGPGQNKYWKSYLKQVAEASEHPFSYKIFDGRKGVSGRSAYSTAECPAFKVLKPRTLLYPTSYTSQTSTAICMGVSDEKLVASMPIVQYNTAGQSLLPPGVQTSYQTFVAYKQEQITTASLLSTPMQPWKQTPSINTGTGLGDYTNDQVWTQIFEIGGVGDFQAKMPDMKKTSEAQVDGFHFEGSQFQPMTDMYVEYVLTIEIVPIQQQTGLINVESALDTEFPTVLMMAQNRDAFPRIVTGHSFWSHFKHAIGSAASAIKRFHFTKSNILALLSTGAAFLPIPGSGLLSKGLSLAGQYTN